MAKIFNKTKKEFTQINNHLLTNSNLTFGARGLIGLMLSRPEEWEFNMDEIASNTKESYYAVQKLIKELETNKYLFRIKRGVPGKKSTFEWLYFLNEVPFSDLDIKEIEEEYLKNKGSNDNAKMTSSLPTTTPISDRRKMGSYINTYTCKNTYVNKTCNMSISKNDLGTNKKGFPIKDKWEKFLIDNISGIDYQTNIQKQIRKLEKNWSRKQIQDYLLETYASGIKQNLSLGLIAKLIANGKRIRENKYPEKKVNKQNTIEIKELIATKNISIEKTKKYLSEQNKVKVEILNGTSNSKMDPLLETLIQKYKDMGLGLGSATMKAGAEFYNLQKSQGSINA